MIIIQTTVFDSLVEDFSLICKKEWPDDFEKGLWDKNVKNLSNKNDASFYLGLENNEVIGGAIVNQQHVVNTFKDPIKTKRAAELSLTDFNNLTYFVMKPGHRGKGKGDLLLKHIIKLHPKLWIKPEEAPIPFYKRNGFVIDSPSTKNEPFPIMTCQR